MTLSSLTLFAVTGSMLALKLAIMVLAVVLLAKALSPGRSGLATFSKAAARMSRRVRSSS